MGQVIREEGEESEYSSDSASRGVFHPFGSNSNLKQLSGGISGVVTDSREESYMPSQPALVHVFFLWNTFEAPVAL